MHELREQREQEESKKSVDALSVIAYTEHSVTHRERTEMSEQREYRIVFTSKELTLSEEQLANKIRDLEKLVENYYSIVVLDESSSRVAEIY